MNDPQYKRTIYRGSAVVELCSEPEPRKHCWHCSRSYTEDDVQIIWAEQNCTRWSTCPFNLEDGEP